MHTIKISLLKNIYEDIKLNNYITEIELSKKYHVCERTIRRYIKILKNKKLVVLMGTGRKRKWIVRK